MASLLQPFNPLLVKLGGVSELKYMASAESAGMALALNGEKWLTGLYLNELLTRLLPKHDPAPTVFSAYGRSLETISRSDEAELTLRRFELILLEVLGYEIQWTVDAAGSKVQADSYYNYYSDRGFIEVAPGSDRAALCGADLMTLNRWFADNAAIDATLRVKLKRIMREAISYRLGGQPLKVRDAFNEWRQLRGIPE